MGRSLDGNGWTVFTPSVNGYGEGTGYSGPGTRIIYVSNAGSDGNPGTFALPMATIAAGAANLRNGSPDWLLLRKGDIWTDDGPLFGGLFDRVGVDENNPILISSYDPGASHSPPVPNPYTGGARPYIILTHAWWSGAGSNGFWMGTYHGGVGYSENQALLGLKLYAASRDPANNGGGLNNWNAADAASGSLYCVSNFSQNGTFLEDCWFGFFSGTLSANSRVLFYEYTKNVTVRRNQFASGYAGVAGFYSDRFVGGPSNGIVMYQNLINQQDWNTGAGFNPQGRCHQLYFTGLGTNGNPYSTSSGHLVDFEENIFTNELSGTAMREGGIFNNNTFFKNARTLAMDQIEAYTSTVTNNVILEAVYSAVNVSTGFEVSHGSTGQGRYINENIVAGSPTVTGNICANALIDCPGIYFGNANHGITATNNIIYNWSWGTPSYGIRYDPGSGTPAGSGPVLTVSINAAGSGYVDRTVTIVGSQSSTTYNDSGLSVGQTMPDNQNYVVFQITPTTTDTYYNTQVYVSPTLAVAGLAAGTYECLFIPTALHGTTFDHVVLYGTTYTGGTTPTTGTLYWGYVHTGPLTSATGSGFYCNIISAGGHIVGFEQYGADNPDSGEALNDPGANYQVNDVLAIPALGGSGSGGSLIVNSVCLNTLTPNQIDATGTNGASFNFLDPNRTVGSWVAYKSLASANATFTASITSGVMTITSISGAVALGDAITWSGQTKADFIKSLGTGTGGTGTYNLASKDNPVQANAASGSMSSYNSQQFINAIINNQSKANWNLDLTANNLNVYIRQGFNVGPAAPAVTVAGTITITNTYSGYRGKVTKVPHA